VLPHNPEAEVLEAQILAAREELMCNAERRFWILRAVHGPNGLDVPFGPVRERCTFTSKLGCNRD
jgi:hypothetical protein